VRLRRLQLPDASGKINVTPLIDVVMCLIVFFLIVGKLAHDQRIRIDLPASRVGLTEKSPDVLIINVVPAPPGGTLPGGTALQSGVPGFRIIIDASTIEPPALEAAIRERLIARPEAIVEVRASRQLAYGAVASVIRACKSAGVASVRLATERAEGGL
jgi:biopolymer transport protein ExbD